MTTLKGLTFGMGLVLSTATALRWGAGLPLGPGEISLFLWMVLALAGQIQRGRVAAPKVATLGLLALATLALGMTLGSLVNALVLDQFWATFSLAVWSRLYLTTLFTLGLAAVFVLEWPFVSMYLRSFRNMYLAYLLLSLTLLILGRLELYGGLRFSAFSENPNQLALLLIAGTFAGLLVRGRWEDRVLGQFTVVVSLCVGWLSRSDALILALPIGLGASLIMLVLDRVQRGRARLIAVAVLCTGVGAVTAPVVPRLLAVVEEVSSAQGDQGGDRLRLWRNGLVAGNFSPVLGFGAGGYSGLDAPFEELEAHNSLIDTYTVSGLVGASALAALMVMGGFVAIRSRNAAMFGLIVALMLFSSFHFLLRQPLFLMGLLLPLVASSPRTSGRTAQPLGATHVRN